MSNAEKFLADAEAEVIKTGGTTTHKIKTYIYYRARKAVVRGPRTLFSAWGTLSPLAALVIPPAPFGVDILLAATEKGLDYVLEERAKRKTKRYTAAVTQGDSSFQALRKAAKWEVKSLPDLLKRLEGNLVKLRHAREAVNRELRTFNALTTAPTWEEASMKKGAWSLALALYVVRHYENKVLMLMQSVRCTMDAVESMAKKSVEETDALEKDLLELLKQVIEEDAVEEPDEISL